MAFTHTGSAKRQVCKAAQGHTHAHLCTVSLRYREPQTLSSAHQAAREDNREFSCLCTVNTPCVHKMYRSQPVQPTTTCCQSDSLRGTAQTPNNKRFRTEVDNFCWQMTEACSVRSEKKLGVACQATNNSSHCASFEQHHRNLDLPNRNATQQQHGLTWYPLSIATDNAVLHT